MQRMLNTRRILSPHKIIDPHNRLHPRSFFCPPSRASGSPSRFLLTGRRRFHSSNGLTLPVRRALYLGGVLVCSSSLVGPPGELFNSTFLDRVARAVVGGLAGANLGALGVATASSIWCVGVVDMSMRSSMSVSAS